MVTAADGFRIKIGSPRTVQSQVIPLQWSTETFCIAGGPGVTEGWLLSQLGGMTGIPCELSNAGSNSIRTWFVLTLPHNAILNGIFVMWESGGVSGGTPLRMYAQKHTITTTTLGLVGAGTGNPTNFVSLKTVNDYISHPENGLGGSSPYNVLSAFLANASTAARTFNSTTDQLVIGFESASAGGLNNRIYWLTINYDLDYVTPPLV
jgi:hypothetical protein